MAAFSAHQLYRSQLKVLANRSRLTDLAERLLADAGHNVRVRHIAGQLQAGARPYAQVWFAARQPHRALFTLQAYAADSDIKSDDPLLVNRHHDARLGVLALRRITYDHGLPGLRALARLPVLRINRYRPGQRLLMRLTTTTDASANALDLRASAVVRSLAIEFDAVSKLLDLHRAMQPRLRPRLAAMAYRRAPGRVLKDALASDNGGAAITHLATVHAQLGHSQLSYAATQGADTMCWQSISSLQQLMRAQPGIADLATNLIGALTAAHARHPGEAVAPALDLQGVDGWLFDSDLDRLHPLAPTPCTGREPELVAAGVYEALVQLMPARADTLFDCYQDVYADRGTALRPRVLRLYRSHRRVAAAVRSSSVLDPYGDETARTHLLEAERLVT